MANVYDRLQALQGKTRDEIVAGSASAEWEKTDLFIQHKGRDGTGNLVEIVLAQCGKSGTDKATPLLAAALKIKDCAVGSTAENTAISAARVAAADALMANSIPYEFGAGDADGNDIQDESSPRPVRQIC